MRRQICLCIGAAIPDSSFSFSESERQSYRSFAAAAVDDQISVRYSSSKVGDHLASLVMDRSTVVLL